MAARRRRVSRPLVADPPRVADAAGGFAHGADAIRTAVRRPQADPRISIVVPVRNESAHLAATLDSLLAQERPAGDFEILVVDGDSEDPTPMLVSEYGERSSAIRLLRNPRRGVAAGRNIGIAAARGELIVIVDGHSTVDGPRWLSAVIDVFDQTGADCAGFPQPLAVEGSSMQRAIALARASRLGRHPASFNYTDGGGFVSAYGAAVAYRRGVFDVVGEFDESFDAAEDMELNHRVDRAGLRCFFTSRISARYAARSSLAALFRQQWRYGRGRTRLWHKHPETFALSTFLPALLLSAVALGSALLPIGPASLSLVLGYPLAVSAAALCTAVRSGEWRLFPAIALALAVTHIAAGLGSLAELACGTRFGLGQQAQRRRSG